MPFVVYNTLFLRVHVAPQPREEYGRVKVVLVAELA